MAYTLAYLHSPVPEIPDPDRRPTPRGPDRQEHFGTEEAALRRVDELLPGSPWLDLRLYGPDGRLIAAQDELTDRHDRRVATSPDDGAAVPPRRG